MKRVALTTILGICMLLTSCGIQQTGIFGNLPELYEDAAERQRAMEAMLRSGETDDEDARQAMALFMGSVRVLQANVTEEAKNLIGKEFPVTASAASGLQPEHGKITNVRPGVVTTVEINIPVHNQLRAAQPSFLYFLDEDGEIVAKSEAWYDPQKNTLRLDVPFAINPDGHTVEKGAFQHYDSAVKLMLISEQEFRSENFNESLPSTLLSLPPVSIQKDTIATEDTMALIAENDTVDNKNTENEKQKWHGPILSAKGIGPVVLGASLKSLPDHLPGVYSNKRLEKQIDEMEEEPLLTATFYEDGKAVMTALGDEQGNIIFLTVESPNIKIDVQGHYFGVGDSLQPLMRLKGVVPDETGAFAASYHGISIAPTPTGLIHAISIGAVW